MGSWYVDGLKKDKVLRYDQPVFASGNGGKYLLLPCLIENNDYEIWGYNWFNLSNGNWNSFGFKSPEEAVKQYIKYGYQVYNVNLIVKRV